MREAVFIPEAQVSVVGEDAVAQEEWRQFPVERRVERLADADLDVTVDVGDDAQVVGDVQVRLARLELQFNIARQRQVDVANLLRVDGELVGADGTGRPQRMVVADGQLAPGIHPQTAPDEITVGAGGGPPEAEARCAPVGVIGSQAEGGRSAGGAGAAHRVLLTRALAADRVALALAAGALGRPRGVTVAPVAVREAVVAGGAAVAGGAGETRAAPARPARAIALLRGRPARIAIASLHNPYPNDSFHSFSIDEYINLKCIDASVVRWKVSNYSAAFERVVIPGGGGAVLTPIAFGPRRADASARVGIANVTRFVAYVALYIRSKNIEYIFIHFQNQLTN